VLVKSPLLVLVLAVTAVVLVVGYHRVGWSRMEAACNAEPPGAPAVGAVSYDWSFWPPGFRCTYDDGRVRTSLWF
jgi:hypothetical protein